MEGEKERQGDFVFTASEIGEYRFCFDNSVSTFSDKIVDFEITVRTPTHQILKNTPNSSTAGRERTPRQPPPKSRRLARPNVRRRRDGPQTVWTNLDVDTAAEVLQDEGEPEFQHGAEYGEADFQLFAARGWVDGGDGGAAGFCRQDVFYGWEEGVCINTGDGERSMAQRGVVT